MYNNLANCVLIIHCGWFWLWLVQYNGGLLPDIIYTIETMLLPVLWYLWMVLVVICTAMFLFVLKFFWCPCMASNVSVQYNGGLFPDIILLTQCYYHRELFSPCVGINAQKV